MLVKNSVLFGLNKKGLIIQIRMNSGEQPQINYEMFVVNRSER